MSYTIEQTVSIRGYTQSLVHELCIYKGSQWVVFDPTHGKTRVKRREQRQSQHVHGAPSVARCDAVLHPVQ